MDRLVKFCLPIEMQNWLKQYQAPQCESAFAKNIPNSWYDQQMAKRLGKIIQIRKKYRGGSIYNQTTQEKIYRRPTAFCHMKWADRFSLYER